MIRRQTSQTVAFVNFISCSKIIESGLVNESRSTIQVWSLVARDLQLIKLSCGSSHSTQHKLVEIRVCILSVIVKEI